MIPPFVGELLLLATGGLVVASLSIGVVAWWNERRELARAGLVAAGVIGLGYALGWCVVLLGSRSRVLAPGREVSFCGLDCHLHVSVAGATRGDDLAVTVRFRSDAKAAPEYPSELRIAVVDDAGREFLPSDGAVAAPLHPGEVVNQEFHFAVPGEAPFPRLVVTRWGGLDYLVLGAGNPLVQRRSRLALGPAS